MMRKPRDFDAELTALTTKARDLRIRKVTQLGELVVASGADMLTIEQLAGALLAAAANKNANDLEAWRSKGAAFFHGQERGARKNTETADGSASASDGAPPSSGGNNRTP